MRPRAVQTMPAKAPPVKAKGLVLPLGRLNCSPSTEVGAVVVVVSPGAVVVVEQLGPVHGTTVVVVDGSVVVVVEQLGPVHGTRVVVVDGSVVVVEHPLWAGLVRPIPWLPSHS